MPLPSIQPSRPLVFLGHPGHELRIHGWLSQARPEIWVLTDGAGADGRPRAETSRRLLAGLGARPGPLFGACSDRTVYEAVLRGEASFFTNLAHRLAERLVAGNHDALVSDMAEGYNPTHDLCELISVAAVTRASTMLQAAPPSHYTFTLDRLPDGEPAQRSEDDIVIDLDAGAVDRKAAAALGYAKEVGGSLLTEIEATLARHGAQAFARERLFRRRAAYEARFLDQAPFYERHGEARVRSGHYAQVIRLREHMLPLARALHAFASG